MTGLLQPDAVHTTCVHNSRDTRLHTTYCLLTSSTQVIAKQFSWGGQTYDPKPTVEIATAKRVVHHSDGDVSVGDVSVGGNKITHVSDLSVVFSFPLNALLLQQLYLIVHVRHATVELVVLHQQSLGRRRQVGISLATILTRHVRQVHQNVFFQPATSAMNSVPQNGHKCGR